MGKFERHLGKPVVFELTNEEGEKDVYSIKPLSFEYMPEFYKVVQVMARIYKENKKDIKDENDEDSFLKILLAINKEDFESLKFIARKSLEISYPEEKSEHREDFLSKHWQEVLNATLEANQHGRINPK